MKHNTYVWNRGHVGPYTEYIREYHMENLVPPNTYGVPQSSLP